MILEKLILESCVDNLDDALEAEKRGASQLELCGDLSIDGITPERELIKTAIQKNNIPVKIMIRPRGGDFVYSNSEFERMISDIRFCREIGVKEIVTGMLDKNNELDIRRLQVLGSIADPMKITIHKCIDEAEDPIKEIKKLQSIPQVKSILTSGKGKTALEGVALLKEMISTFRGQFVIIPAGKITQENLKEVHDKVGAEVYHGRRIV